jgi:hypothetical protein
MWVAPIVGERVELHWLPLTVGRTRIHRRRGGMRYRRHNWEEGMEGICYNKEKNRNKQGEEK